MDAAIGSPCDGLTERAAALWRLMAPSTSQPACADQNDNVIEELVHELLGNLSKSGAGVRLRRHECGVLVEPIARGAVSPCAVVYCTSGDDGGAGGGDIVSSIEVLLCLRIAVLLCHRGLAPLPGGGPSPSAVRYAVKFLRSSEGGDYASVALWGRAKGAAVALQCASEDPSFAAVVCDNVRGELGLVAGLPRWAFQSLQEFRQIGESLPSLSALSSYCTGVTFSGASGRCRGCQTNNAQTSCCARSALDEGSLAAPACLPQLLDVATRCFVPALILHSSEDGQAQARALHRVYAGEKQLLLAEGGTHNTAKLESMMAKVALFFVRAFRRKGETDPELAAITSQLARRAASKSGRPQLPVATNGAEVSRLLAECDPEVRRKGLLLAALLACPALHAASFSRVPLVNHSDIGSVGGRQDGGLGEPYLLRIVAAAELPEVENEVALAWATLSDNADGEEGIVGYVHYVLVSASMASLTVVKLAPTTGPLTVSCVNETMSIPLEDTGEFIATGSDELANIGLVANVETLAIQQMQRASDSACYHIELFVNFLGEIDLAVDTLKICSSSRDRGHVAKAPNSADIENRLEVSFWAAICRSHAADMKNESAEQPLDFTCMGGRRRHVEKNHQRKPQLDFSCIATWNSKSMQAQHHPRTQQLFPPSMPRKADDKSEASPAQEISPCCAVSHGGPRPTLEDVRNPFDSDSRQSCSLPAEVPHSVLFTLSDSASSGEVLEPPSASVVVAAENPDAEKVGGNSTPTDCESPRGAAGASSGMLSASASASSDTPDNADDFFCAEKIDSQEQSAALQVPPLFLASVGVAHTWPADRLVVYGKSDQQQGATWAAPGLLLI